MDLLRWTLTSFNGLLEWISLDDSAGWTPLDGCSQVDSPWLDLLGWSLWDSPLMTFLVGPLLDRLPLDEAHDMSPVRWFPLHGLPDGPGCLWQ